jgi:hypothetical protein
MKAILFFIPAFLVISFNAQAQQRLNPKEMSYLIMPKPNTIIFHDTVYSGKKQFESLFYRTHDEQLIRLLEKHQSNKVAGQVLGLAGTIAIIIGVGEVSGTPSNKSLGWSLIGGGFAATLTGGYLAVMGQKNLITAVTLFNQKYHLASLGIGVSQSSAGLVYKF